MTKIFAILLALTLSGCDNIIYSDIKPGNCFINDTFNRYVKIKSIEIYHDETVASYTSPEGGYGLEEIGSFNNKYEKVNCEKYNNASRDFEDKQIQLTLLDIRARLSELEKQLDKKVKK